MTTVAHTHEVLPGDERHTLALLIAEILAVGALPAEAHRLRRAAKVVLNFQVHRQEDGSYQVESQSQTGTRYTATCTTCTCVCAMYNPHIRRCTHSLAVALEKKVERLMSQQYYGADLNTGEWGVATHYEPDAEHAFWLFQTPGSPLPLRIHRGRLMLSGNCQTVAQAD